MTEQIRRDPEDWKTGDEPMTAAQASYLRTLSEEAGEPFDDSLTKAQASERIDALQSRSPRLGSDETSAATGDKRSGGSSADTSDPTSSDEGSG